MRTYLAVNVMIAIAVFSMAASASKPVLNFSPQVPAATVQQITSDMEMVNGLQGSGGTAIFRNMFGDGLSGSNFIQFFNERISSFDMHQCGGGPAVAACVRPGVDPHIMWITKNYTTFNMPQIYRVSIIFHESRHTEASNDFWGHVNCPTPFKDAQGNDIKGIISGTILAGLAACDTTAFGAYALQAELLKNIQLSCTNCSDKMKMDGELFGNDTIKRISDKQANAQLTHDVESQH